MSRLMLCMFLGLLMSAPLYGQVSAHMNESSIDVHIGKLFFTTYRFSDQEKYPYFYPLNGPSGASVTSIRNGTYPHHSSLFFGCDRVNGGNYWQEGLERGQILAVQTNVEASDEDEVVIVQECLWTRPDAEALVKDIRRITIRAASDDLFQIDFDITLQMLQDVKIERTNHSLFSVRMDPDLAVVNGGVMINAEGDLGEEATFGKSSAWMDYYGTRGDFKEGVALLQHPSNNWYPAPWFTRDYGFISPTPMYWPEDPEQGMHFSQGDRLRLRYRVLVHQGDHQQAGIAEQFDIYKQE